MVQLVEAFATKGDRAAQVPDPEMDPFTDLQPLLHSRSPSVWKWLHAVDGQQDRLLFDVASSHLPLCFFFFFLVSVCLALPFKCT